MKYFNFLVIILGFSLHLVAQDVEFKASAPKVVSQGERFRITYSVNAEASGFGAPDLSAFSYSGPSVSNSSSIQIVNGEMTQSYSYSYTYFAQSSQVGSFTIPPATVKVKGNTYKSNSLTIEVVGNRQSGNNQAGGQGNETQGATEDLFLRILLSDTEVYVGEPLVATLKLYSRVDLAGFEEMNFPSYSGFWSQELQSPRQISLERETISGVIYNAGLIRQNLLFPQKTGEIEIESFIAEVVVGRRSIFGVQPAGTRKLVSPTRKVRVKALPANKPESFSGAVGNFQFSVSMDKSEVSVNDAIALTVKVSGTGNLKLIDNPVIAFPPDFEVYDPKVSDALKNGQNGTTGSRTYEYLIIPRHSGNFKIPPIQFSYFHPASASYKTLKSKEFEIKVSRAEGGAESEIASTTSRKEDIQVIGEDIRYIKTGDSNLVKPKSLFYRSDTFFMLYWIPLVLFVLLFVILRKQAKANADQVRMRNRKANKISRKRLKLAQKSLKAKNTDEFYSEVLQALWGYLGDKLGLQASNLDRNTVQEALVAQNTGTSTMQELFQLLDTCEYAKFAPGVAGNEPETIYKNAEKMIQRLEKELVNTKK